MIPLEQIQKLEPGMVVDLTMVSKGPWARKAKYPGKTLRMIYTSSNVLMLRSDQLENLDGRMMNPVSRMIYGRAVLTNVPEHVFVPVDDPVQAELTGHMYGVHAWLAERMEVVGVAI